MSRRRSCKTGRRGSSSLAARRGFQIGPFEFLEPRYVFSSAQIIAENQLPGTPESVWDLPAGQTGSTNIVGFAAQFSVDVGQTVQFKVDTDASKYEIDIYRIGYYKGDGARLITTITPPSSAPHDQPDPVTDYTTNTVDCSNWAVSASWNVPTTAVSGVYVADLIRDDGTYGMNQIIFVVRNDASHSDIVMQTSDTTWEAYNDWGGYSLYTPNYPSGRALAVSYERPFNNRATSNVNYFFAEEYPMIRYLEENGYDVSYMAGVDTARDGALIQNHKIFVSVGHDEYWSAEQVDSVTAARDAGVCLAFFSGNEIFWKTRWEDDDAGDPYGTMVCYKETLDDALTDPDTNVWTGTWADPRFSPPTDGGLAQNSLTGTLFTINQINASVYDASTSMNLTSQYSALRFWRNTSVASLTGNQSITIGDHVLGYEADSDVDNGFRPAGLIDLEATTVSVTQALYDYGATFGPGTVTQNMTMYRAASGALVFGAGTVQYVWGLDNHHDIYDGATDKNLQQATINLFADMGVQPGSLMSGLVPATQSTDTQAPVSTITSPAAGTTYAAGTTVTVKGTAKDLGGGIVAGVEVSVDGGLTWHPATGTTSWSYTFTTRSTGQITVMSRATDDSANMEKNGPQVVINPQAAAGTYTLFGSSTPGTVDSGDPSAIEVGIRFQSDVDAYITGIRFYKAPNNTGTHVAHLWTEAGLLVATATFTNETASGWQQVNFSSPVLIQANTPYIASYYAPNGHYSDDTSYFATQGVDNGPLHALPTGTTGPNGVYNYGSSAFPTQTYASTNYWVDVVANTNVVPDTTAPTVTSFAPADGSATLTTDSAITVTFSEPLNAALINSNTVELLEPDLTSVPAGCCGSPGGWCSGCPMVQGATTKVISANVTYNASSDSVTLTPLAPLSTASYYTVLVKGGTTGVEDLAGNPLANDTAASFLTPNQPASTWSSVFSSTTTPTTADAGDPKQVELGMKFYSDTSGTIAGVRFYKSANNTGTHTASLWTSTGQLLATTTFTNESASGWQEAFFATPVAITAGTTYVVSYNTTSGHYSADHNFFSAQYNSGSLHVPANGGVYLYGAGFPTQSSAASNYYVDVIVRTPVPVDNVAPTVVGVTPAAKTTNVAVNASIAVTFSEAVDPTTVSGNTIKLVDGNNQLVPTTVTYNSANDTATITPTSPLAYSNSYTVIVTGGVLGVKDLAGNPVAQTYSSSFTTAGAPAPDTTPPTVISTNPANAATNIGINGPFTLTFSESLNPASVTSTNVVLLQNGLTHITGMVSYNAATNTVTLTPSAPLNYLTNYTLWVAPGANSVRDLSGNSIASGFTSNFTTGAAPVISTLFSSTAAPATVDSGDTKPLEVGMQFTPTTSGMVTGVRFYKAAGNTGTHIGNLWSSTGQLLATATFTNETASGWQQVNFATPVAVTAGTTYVVSYFDPNGHYSVNLNYFTAPITSGQLQAPANAGVYKYGSSSVFPNQAYQGSNYWVDAILSTNPPADLTPPTVVSVTPASGATNVATAAAITVTFSEALNPGSVSSSTVQLLDSDNSLVTAAVTYNSANNTATITPLAPLANSATYTVNIVGGIPGIHDVAGNLMTQSVSSKFTTVAADTTPPTVTSFTPAGGSTSVATSAAITIAFSEALNSSTVNANSIQLLNGTTVVPASVTYNSAANSVTITPTAALANSTTYTISVLGGANGVKDLAGNALAKTTTSTFTTATAADTTPPTVTGFSPAGGATGVATSAAISVTFSEALNAASVTTSTVQLLNGTTVVPASVTYNSAANTVTITPTAALSNSTTYTISVLGGTNGVKDLAGNALSKTTTSTFTTIAAPVATTLSLWSNSTTPATVDSGDKLAVEVGLKFTSDVNGYITGIRFYKASTNTGTHVANLWSSTGALLATGTFVNETASGWQQVNFSTPVAITAGQTYTASYHDTAGHYSVSTNYFKSQVSNGTLHALASGGVYAYGSTSVMPTASYQSSNYWVDVVFSTSKPADTMPPTVTAVTPANSSTTVTVGSAITVTFSEALTASTVTSSTVMLKDSTNAVVPATVSYNAATNTATLTPANPLLSGATYTIVVKSGSAGVKDLAGNALAADFTSTFTTLPSTVSLFAASATPATVDSGDKQAAELGVKFTADVSGYITGIRFYKASTNTGTHVANLWSSTGALLATGTFVNETASGWQQVLFTTPVAITAGQTYTASYHETAGHYSVSTNYFTTQLNSGVLHGLVSGGVYAYGATSVMPTKTYQSSNYWVDVVFSNTKPLSIASITPAAGATAVASNSTITLTFSGALNPASVNTSTILLQNGTSTVAATVTYNATNNTVTITPKSLLASATKYTVVVKSGTAGVKDLSGNSLSSDFSSTFTTK